MRANKGAKIVLEAKWVENVIESKQKQKRATTQVSIYDPACALFVLLSYLSGIT